MNKLAAFFRDFSTARFFLPLGIMLIVFGILIIAPIQRIKNFPKTQGTVSRLELEQEGYSDRDGYHEPTYRVFVKYMVEGREYESEYGVFSGYEVGKSVSVAYNPADPTDIAQPNGMLVPILMIAAGVAALAGSVINIINTTKKRRALKEQEESWANGVQ